jgi:Protein of unknown function (DUF3054)
MTTRRIWLAPVLDLVCIIGFILGGAGQHNINEGASWFLMVLWPLAVGWYGVSLLTKLYTNPDRAWVRLAATLAGGMLVGSVLRGTFTDRPMFSIFTVIYVAWMILTAFGWRFVAMLWKMRRTRRQRVARAM